MVDSEVHVQVFVRWSKSQPTHNEIEYTWIGRGAALMIMPFYLYKATRKLIIDNRIDSILDEIQLIKPKR